MPHRFVQSSMNWISPEMRLRRPVITLNRHQDREKKRYRNGEIDVMGLKMNYGG